jgi:DNA repair protein RecN (Recombination protein N)
MLADAGDRAEADRVRTGASRADITATFDTSAIPSAQEWLLNMDLQQPDNPQECLLRRLINNEGKSKSYINGQPVTLQQLRILGEMLIDIHSQHEHQSLLIKDTHRRLIDEFAGQADLAKQVRLAFREWQSRLEHFIHLRDNAADVSARFQLLSYQFNELEQLGLQPGEQAKLEAEQRSLANAEEILHGSQQLAAFCGDDEQGLSVNLHRALHILRNLPEKSTALQTAEELLTSAQIQVEEAQHEIDRHIDSFNLDPARLAVVEDRLSAIYDIARKHRIQPEELPAFIEKLSAELEQLQGGDGKLDQLAQQVAQAEKAYRQLAEQLSAKRSKAGTSLAKQVNEQLKLLAMTNANLSVSLLPLADKPGPNGLEDVEFLISTNPGQAPRPLAKIASGGELSRISLAIQVITAKTSATPTLVFDEVDVGIGGATGDVVGQLLRQLGERGQVICVTHLAQVASKGHQHLQVVKTASKKSAESTLVELSGEGKVEEIARMLGGLKITDQSLAHAREMLAL